MRPLTKTVFLTLGCAVWTTLCYSQKSVQYSTPNQSLQKIPKKQTGASSTRPRVPSNQYIGFEYALGRCYFTLPEAVSDIIVSMENKTGIQYSAYVTAQEPVCDIYMEQGEYHIECAADNGNIFEGIVWID
ncbi:MAG: hypothetical protein NC453_24420 [Muribaculum sp.]|nr:hypothetical protein [Muribaculum sp.]